VIIKRLFPWWLKIFAKILLSRLPIKHSTWRSFSLFAHSAKNADEFGSAVKTFGRYLFIAQQYITIKKDFNCLELGPGDSIITSLAAKKQGAGKYYLVDTHDYANVNLKHLIDVSLDIGLSIKDYSQFQSANDFLSYNGIKYKTNGMQSYNEIPDSTIDFAWSKSVLEHICISKFERTFKELHRILKHNAIAIHSVDFRDHLSGGINNLRFNKTIWESYLFKNSGFYTNRLRPSQMKDLFIKNGFKVTIFRQDFLDELPLSRNRLSREFRNLSDDDLRTTGMIFVIRAIKK
tara:strand:- start:325 stop:1197 length:873 start_codon:yes stop_codon:yes gene_type:complete